MAAWLNSDFFMHSHLIMYIFLFFVVFVLSRVLKMSVSGELNLSLRLLMERCQCFGRERVKEIDFLQTSVVQREEGIKNNR